MKEHKIQTGPPKDWETLYRLRDLTRRIGALHEIQINNLKMWPIVILNAREADCSFDYENKLLTYDIKSLDGPRPSEFKQRLKILEASVKQLLGDEYEVVIKFNKARGGKNGRHS